MGATILDIRTLSVVSVCFGLFFGFSLIIVSMVQRKFPGLRCLGLGHTAMGVGFLFLSLRHQVPALFSIILANACILAGVILTLEGLQLMLRLRPKWRMACLSLLAAQVGFFLYFTYVDPNINARIATISLCLFVVILLCAIQLLRPDSPVPALPRTFSAVPFLGMALYCLVRTLWALGESPLRDFFQAGLMHAVGFVSVDILLALSSFGYFWMISAMLDQELVRLARIDPLTGACNRRALEELQAREMARAKRYGVPLSLLIADLDHFKAINDKYGHQTGDKVLVRTAAMIRSNLRAQDIFARYGGEEFVILLPDTPLEPATMVAEKLRAQAERSNFGTEECRLPMRLSFGVAQLSDANSSWEALLAAADKALYAAKEMGRNQVVAA